MARRAGEGAAADLGPDAKEVAQHLERVRQHPQPRRLAVVPLDRHLADPPALGAGAGEQLDVEAPALDRGRRQHRLDGLRGEQLEAALGVLDARQHHRADQHVEDAAEQVPVQRLADAHRARALAAADGDVAPRRQHVEEARDLRRRHRQIGVAQEAAGAERGEQAVAQRRALAAVRQAQHADARLAGRRRRDDGRGVVGRPVVRNQDLPRERQRVERRHQAIERRADPAGLVVGRDDDRQIDRRRHEPPP